MNNQDSILDFKNRKMEKNMSAIKQPDGKFKLVQKMEYYEDPLRIHTSQNSHKEQVEATTLRLNIFFF